MIPNTPDCDYPRGEKPFTIEEIQFFKESFQDYQIVDKNHQVFLNLGSAKQIGEPVDSFLLDEDTTYELIDGTMETYPKGTWMLTTDVTDPLTQQEIEKGILTGYSPSVHTQYIGELIKEAMAVKASQGQLIRDIQNPNTITVSIVRKPCQSGSKQCKIGSEVMSDDKKTLDKIKDLLGGDTKEYATKEDFDALAAGLKENNAAIKSLGENIAGISDSIAKSIADALSEVGAVKSRKPEDEDEDEDETAGKNKPSKNNPKPSKGDGKGNDDEDEDEEEDELKKKKRKSGSKQGSVHNGATKSNHEDLDTYAFLGRKPDGTVKRR